MRKSLYLFALSLVPIFLLLVVLFFSGYSIHRNSARRMLTATDTLMMENPSIHLMDSALFVLNDAESNFRLYTVFYKRDYLQTFSDELGSVLGMIDTVSHSFRSSGKDKHFDTLIQQKEQVSGRIAKLKSATDSMLTRTIKNEMLDNLLNSIRSYNVRQIKKDKVKVDTVSTTQDQPTAKKGLFRRLGNAFANKKAGDTVKAQVRILVRTRDGKVIDKEKYDAQQLRKVVTNVNDYYKDVLRRQLANRMKLNEEESTLAGTNIAMMEEMKELLVSLREYAASQARQKKVAAHVIVTDSAQEMKKIVLAGLVALLICLVVIAFTAWKVWENNRLLKKGKMLAEEQTRVRTDFLNNMSHEMRTPLNSVAGFTEQLSYTRMNTEQQLMVQSIETATDMLIQVVNDVLDFSKLEQDYISLVPQPFVLYQVYNDVINIMRVQAAKKNLELNVSFEGDKHGQANGDVFRLKQVLLNLISNAIKYTDKGSVTVTAILELQQTDRWLFGLVVSDTGEGISKDAQEHLFERFFQAGNSRSSSKGTGLGLAITKRLITMQGGDISVSSELNKGSVFTCHIPYEKVNVPLMVTKNTNELHETVGASMEGRYVLVADDQEMNLLLLKMILTRWKCRFDMATSGTAALELFHQYHYDLVLLDIHMPEMGGLEVAENIRKDKDPEKAATIVLALTANITASDEERLRKAGFNGWLLKPFREKEIYEAIMKQLPVATSR
jgi:signal transduction histidine kinase/ActR/RegA family two-component response regulator